MYRLLFVLIPLALASSLAAQGTAPKRPRLAAGADTVDAAAYLSHGLNVMEQRPYEAADAFYWASRIDPTWAEPLYARRTALMMADTRRLESYLEGNRRVIESAATRQIDSLYYRALVLNPFLYRKFDRQLIRVYLKSSYERSVRQRAPGAQIDYALLDHWINQYMQATSPAMRAWSEYSAGRFHEALASYAAALKKSRNPSDIHADRARIFFMIGNDDSARVAMAHAVEQMRSRDEKALVYFYESKALYEHSIGMIHERRGDREAAREAYGRALQEDLSYHPAHARLAVLAAEESDTATAVSEMDLAVQIRGDDAGLRLTYAQMLAMAGRLGEAVEQLRRAVELEPYYAAPYHLLGRILDVQADPEAIEQYRAFLARASRRDPQRRWVEQRLAGLGVDP